MQQLDPTEWLSTSKLQWNMLVPTPVDDITKPPALLRSHPPVPDPTLPSTYMPAWLAAQLHPSSKQVLAPRSDPHTLQARVDFVI